MNFIHETAQLRSVVLGRNIKIFAFCNIYGCSIGSNTTIGAGTEIQAGAKIGKNCKIGAGVFIPEGVTIENNCFLGPNSTFVNDLLPRACKNGKLKKKKDWKLKKTKVCKGASIGANATILPVNIGSHALIGAGAVVTHNVPRKQVWAGNPARKLK